MRAAWLLCIAILAGAMSVAPASAQQITWIRQFGTAAGDTALAVAVDSTGVYVVGVTGGVLPGRTSRGGEDVFLRKYTASGQVLWTRQFGTSAEDYGRGVAVSGGSVYVVGHTHGAFAGQTNRGDADAFLRRYDSDGNAVWTRQFGTSRRDWALGLALDATSVYVAGTTDGALPGQTNVGGDEGDAFVRKYDSNGNVVWTRQFGTQGIDLAVAIAADATGVYVAGKVGSCCLSGEVAPGEDDAFVRKYDASGNVVWTRQFGMGPLGVPTSAHDVAVVGGTVYVTGATSGTLPGQTSKGSWDAYVRAYDSNGNEVWTRQFGTSRLDYGSGVRVRSGGVYVAGSTHDDFADYTNAGSADWFVRKYDLAGNKLWTSQLGTSGPDEAYGIAVRGGGVYVVGYVLGTLPGQTGQGGVDACVVKLSTG